jgi:1,2-diacylglycerol 3-beta-galactosyltransferase
VAGQHRVVVVYSRVGGGHLSAAKALAAELESTGQCNVRVVDAYLECGRFPVTRFPWAYAGLARHHPRLWSLIYYLSASLAGEHARGLSPGMIVGPFLRSGFQRLMSDTRPDLVISVLPVVNGLLVTAAAQAGARVEVVLTDWHSVHPFWEGPGVQHYTTPTESARRDCIRFGTPAEMVDVIGIPVRREFAAVGREPRSQRLSALGLEPRRFTILAMVGAEGSPLALRNLASLACAELDAQLLVVCGRSDELRKRIERLPSRVPVKALGFVEDVADLMRSADVLITKGGGLTLAEAFCCGVPVVIDDVLPGQEAGNLEYVVQKGAALYAPRPEELVRVITELAADPRRRAELAERGKRLARPEAARQIVEGALARLARGVEFA